MKPEHNLPPHGQPPLGLHPCIVCQAPTRRTVLSLLGGRCGRCYDEYCRAPPLRKKLEAV